jgi:hypothetical protein
MSTPTRRTPSGCCARTANGHAAAAPSPAMNSRRRIDHLPKLRTAYRVLASRRWPPRARRWGAAVATQVSRHFFPCRQKNADFACTRSRSGRCRQLAYLRGGAAEDSRHSQPRGGGAGEIEIEFVVERRVDRAGRYAYEERVAIRPRVHDCRGSDVAVPPPVLFELLAEVLRQPLPHQAPIMPVVPPGIFIALLPFTAAFGERCRRR